MDNKALDRAKHFVEQRFPSCKAALLVGSAVLGKLGDHSDLDLIVIVSRLRKPYRQTFEVDGTLFETQILTEAAVNRLSNISILSGTGAFLRMCARGVLLRDDAYGCGAQLQQRAAELWQAGPPSWTLDELNEARYAITEELFDFIDADEPEVTWFIAFRLVELTTVLLLRANDQWSGIGKWLLRALREYDPIEADNLQEALQQLFEHRQKEPLVTFVERTLEPFGGTLLVDYRQSVNMRKK